MWSIGSHKHVSGWKEQFLPSGKISYEETIFKKARGWRTRYYFANRNTKNNHKTYNKKAESGTVKMIEKRVQNKPCNTRRLEGPLAITRLSTRYEKIAG